MSRNHAIDFFRGLALLAIVADHIPGSPLSGWTLRNFALCDATEVFVFLAGLAAGIAYLKISARSGAWSAASRMLKRSWTLYSAYVAMAFALLASGSLLGHFGLSYSAVWPGYVDRFENDTLSYVLQIGTMMAQPSLSDVLPLYVILIFLTPLLITALVRRPIISMALSFAVWSIAPFLNAALPHERVAGFLFNPFAWQLLFCLGILTTVHGKTIFAVLDSRSRVVTAVGAAYSIAAALLAISWSHPWLHEVLVSPALADIIYPISKPNLDIMRIAGFLSLAWLARELFRHVSVNWESTLCYPLLAVGRNGLPCFAYGTLISVYADAISHNLRIAGADYLADATAIAAVVLIGVASDRGVTSELFRRIGDLAAHCGIVRKCVRQPA